ncbi:hypothetical protein [Marinobacter sp. CHS3-4]|uniref:hypothetical protein n=1 Tax=Marinobacter sp. CHS3-4 TaxID=3045174 RepID=UPI0024B5E606|nr:hypothetical protein [Marinobacter sp. CHS3-4]MDI9244689.1 hypothetical protein [Marinobacter sp. CHS3-4]
MVDSVRSCWLMLGILVLSGCKVTAGTEDDYYGGDGHYVHGHFYDARDTGAYFPDTAWGLKRDAAACIDETLYFETANERVRVYGSPAYSETTFRVTAAEMDNRIDHVLSKLRMSWHDFVAERSAHASYPDQLIACLSPRVSSTELSSASLAAVAVAPYHSAWPYDSGKIFTHHLAHYAQENLSRSVADHTLLPLWFAEGQARIIAGEPVAAPYQHYDYDPLWDATASQAGTASYRYEHYALAYRYLKRANGTLAMTLLLDLVQYMDWTGDYVGQIVTGESLAFVEAFNAMDLVDHRGQYLSFARFRADYHELLEASY